jgi:hypothetical protein
MDLEVLDSLSIARACLWTSLVKESVRLHASRNDLHSHAHTLAPLNIHALDPFLWCASRIMNIWQFTPKF